MLRLDQAIVYRGPVCSSIIVTGMWGTKTTQEGPLEGADYLLPWKENPVMEPPLLASGRSPNTEGVWSCATSSHFLPLRSIQTGLSLLRFLEMSRSLLLPDFQLCCFCFQKAPPKPRSHSHAPPWVHPVQFSTFT